MAGKIRIRLQGFDHAILDQASADIVRTVEKTGSRVSGPVPLPTKTQRWTVLRSPHAGRQRCRFAEISAKPNPRNALFFLRQFVDFVPGTVCGTVIDEDQFKFNSLLITDRHNFLQELRQAPFFVEHGNNDRQHHSAFF